MILGDPDQGLENKDKIKPSAIAITALVINPIAIAFGNLAMRSMRKLNENVVSCWMSFSMIIIFVPIVFI